MIPVVEYHPLPTNLPVVLTQDHHEVRKHLYNREQNAAQIDRQLQHACNPLQVRLPRDVDKACAHQYLHLEFPLTEATSMYNLEGCETLKCTLYRSID